MASVPDTTHLPWWLGPHPSPSQSLLAGVQAGSAIRSNNLRAQQMMMESAQNVRREETATRLKMMDLGLEKERNDIALKAFQSKHDAEKLRSQAMSEIGEYLGSATVNDKLTDPETQAGFWRLTSKYSPFLPETAVNSMWDNTFKAATDRKESAKKLELQQFNADRRAGNAEDRLRIMQERLDLSTDSDEHRRAIADARLSLDEAKAEGTEENRSALLAIAERKLNMAESFAKERSEIAKGNLELRRAELEARAESHRLSTERLKARLPESTRIQYESRIKALENMARDGLLRKTDGSRPSRDEYSREYERQLDAIDAEFGIKPAGTNAPIPTSATGTKDSPYLPATPAEAEKLKPGEWFLTPDGRLIQRK